MKQKFKIGDIIELYFTHLAPDSTGEVIKYDEIDNKRVYVRLNDGTERSWVSENCRIINKK
jgi:hypothetical protein